MHGQSCNDYGPLKHWKIKTIFRSTYIQDLLCFDKTKVLSDAFFDVSEHTGQWSSKTDFLLTCISDVSRKLWNKLQGPIRRVLFQFSWIFKLFLKYFANFNTQSIHLPRLRYPESTRAPQHVARTISNIAKAGDTEWAQCINILSVCLSRPHDKWILVGLLSATAVMNSKVYI